MTNVADRRGRRDTRRGRQGGGNALPAACWMPAATAGVDTVSGSYHDQQRGAVRLWMPALHRPCRNERFDLELLHGETVRQFFVVRELFMFLDVLPFKNDTARLVRVYGGRALHHPAGGSARPGRGGTLTITELGDYCFSEKPRGLPAPEELCRYAVEPRTAPRCLLRAFGRDLTGVSHARYDLDFGDGDASTAAPERDEEALHPLCGSFLEEAGPARAACGSSGAVPFTTAARLRRLSAGAGELTMGSDVFLNCFALEDAGHPGHGRSRPPACLRWWPALPRRCRRYSGQRERPRPLAGLWYPAYWEDIEETPAHILLHTFSGQGYHYRQCFLEWKIPPGRSTTPSSRRGTTRMTPT